MKNQTLLQASEAVHKTIVIAKTNNLLKTHWKINVKFKKRALRKNCQFLICFQVKSDLMVFKPVDLAQTGLKSFVFFLEIKYVEKSYEE